MKFLKKFYGNLREIYGRFPEVLTEIMLESQNVLDKLLEIFFILLTIK